MTARFRMIEQELSEVTRGCQHSWRLDNVKMIYTCKRCEWELTSKELKAFRYNRHPDFRTFNI